MNYPFLKIGDKLPAVGVLQKLLNRTGAALQVDGDFGSRTQAAVQHFQRNRHLSPDGKVGQNTWPRLVAGVSLPIIDCIDVWDPDLYQLERRDIIRVGGNPIVIGGMCNGVEHAVQQIVSAARNIFLLRFHGHGAPGTASIATGRGELDPNMVERSDIALSNLATIRPIIRRLSTIFGPYGCVQFMHCKTGRGPNGRSMLNQISLDIGVPVSAGIWDQLGGGLTTFAFEGPTYTAVPGGSSLGGWCRARPDFAGFTPA